MPSKLTKSTNAAKALPGAVVRPADDAPAGLVERTLGVIELLAHNAQGLQLIEIAERLQMPRSATHRVLTSLVEHNYVRQERWHGAYLLTAKIASLTFAFLAGSGITDMAQPILDRLARECGELVRLAIVDGRQLTWVAKAQGTTSGLRYDPDMGQQGRLSCSSSGHAWLSCLDEDEALSLVAAQGFGARADYGPRAPTTASALLKYLRLARNRGYAITVQTFTPWMNAIAVPVRNHATGEVVGTVSIAGPHVRFTEQRMHKAAPLALAAARELALAMAAAPHLGASSPDGSRNIFAEPRSDRKK
jgi:DNA-binding IclR family transcriptional regulator